VLSSSRLESVACLQPRASARAEQVVALSSTALFAVIDFNPPFSQAPREAVASFSLPAMALQWAYEPKCAAPTRALCSLSSGFVVVLRRGALDVLAASSGALVGTTPCAALDGPNGDGPLRSLPFDEVSLLAFAPDRILRFALCGIAAADAGDDPPPPHAIALIARVDVPSKAVQSNGHTVAVLAPDGSVSIFSSDLMFLKSVPIFASALCFLGGALIVVDADVDVAHVLDPYHPHEILKIEIEGADAALDAAVTPRTATECDLFIFAPHRVSKSHLLFPHSFRPPPLPTPPLPLKNSLLLSESVFSLSLTPSCPTEAAVPPPVSRNPSLDMMAIFSLHFSEEMSSLTCAPVDVVVAQPLANVALFGGATSISFVAIGGAPVGAFAWRPSADAVEAVPADAPSSVRLAGLGTQHSLFSDGRVVYGCGWGGGCIS
jgi:hypothetical protein